VPSPNCEGRTKAMASSLKSMCETEVQDLREHLGIKYTCLEQNEYSCTHDATNAAHTPEEVGFALLAPSQAWEKMHSQTSKASRDSLKQTFNKCNERAHRLHSTKRHPGKMAHARDKISKRPDMNFQHKLDIQDDDIDIMLRKDQPVRTRAQQQKASKRLASGLPTHGMLPQTRSCSSIGAWSSGRAAHGFQNAFWLQRSSYSVATPSPTFNSLQAPLRNSLDAQVHEFVTHRHASAENNLVELERCLEGSGSSPSSPLSSSYCSAGSECEYSS